MQSRRPSGSGPRACRRWDARAVGPMAGSPTSGRREPSGDAGGATPAPPGGCHPVLGATPPPTRRVAARGPWGVRAGLDVVRGHDAAAAAAGGGGRRRRRRPRARSTFWPRRPQRDVSRDELRGVDERGVARVALDGAQNAKTARRAATRRARARTRAAARRRRALWSTSATSRRASAARGSAAKRRRGGVRP